MFSLIKKVINRMRRKKVINDDVLITHNNIMLDMHPALIAMFRSRAIKELEEKKNQSFTKD